MMKKLRQWLKLLAVVLLVCLASLTGSTSAKYAYTYSYTVGGQGIALNGHELAETKHNPTCEKDGYTTYTCSHEGCEHTYTVEDKGSAGHVWSEYKAANHYTYQGQVKYYVVYRECYACGKVELRESASQEEMEELLRDLINESLVEHTYIIKDEAKPTCTKGGFIYYTCSCEDPAQHAFTEAVEPLGHDYQTVATVEPGCITIGYTLHSCSRCTDSYTTDEKESRGHELTPVGTSKAPTCTEDGHTEAQFCGNCEQIIYESESLPALGHDYAGTVWYISEGEDAAAVHEGICTRSGCGVTIFESHGFVEVYSYEPTCTEVGYSIQVCAWVDEDGRPARLYAHTQGEMTGYVMHDEKGEPVTDENGDILWCAGVEVKNQNGEQILLEGNVPLVVRVKHDGGCCGYQRAVTLDALGHDKNGAEDLAVVSATCIADGEETYTCVRCKDHITEILPMTGHSYNSGVETRAATCTAEGTTTYTCTVCNGELENGTQTEPIPALGHSKENAEEIDTLKEATCTAQGIIQYTCDRCEQPVTESTATIPHDYAFDYVTVATCTENGASNFFCTVCNAREYEENIVEEALGHIFVENDTATCQSGGTLTKTCVLCGYSEESDSPVRPHNLMVRTEAREPTCTKAGMDTVYYCTYEDCSYTQGGATIPMVGHSSRIKKVPETCSEPGYSVAVCSRCGVQLGGQYDFVAPDPALHDYESVEGTNTATCTLAGQELRRCRHCGDEKTADVAALGHDLSDEVTLKEPACTEAGEKYLCCARCGHIDYAVIAIPATGHQWGDVEVVKEASCTENGQKSAVCTVCSETYSETIPKLGHDYVVKAEATCKVKGYEVCSRCGDSRIIPIQPCAYGSWNIISAATGCERSCEQGVYIHGLRERTCKWCGAVDQQKTYKRCTYDEVERVAAADCGNPGYVKRVCRYCGDITTETLTAAHKWGAYVQINEPTCAKGSTSRRECSVCGKTESRTNGDKTGNHQWSEDFIIILAPDCENGVPGRKEYTCTVCGLKKTELIPVGENGHTWVPGETTPPDCIQAGHLNYTCSVCGQTKTEPTGESALGHNWDAGVTTPPDYDNQIDGQTVYTCQRCGAQETVRIPYAHEHTPDYAEGTQEACENGIRCKECDLLIRPAGHAYGEGAVTAPTCTAEGYTAYTCAVCGHAYRDEITEKIPHSLRLVGGHQPIFDDEGNLETVGVLVYSCTVCGHYELKDLTEYSEMLQKTLETMVTNNHEYYIYVGKTPACAEDGSYHIFCMYHGVSVDYDHAVGTFSETFKITIEEETKPYTQQVALEEEELDFTSLNKYEIYSLSDVMNGSYGVLPQLNGHYAQLADPGQAALEAGTAEWRTALGGGCDASGEKALTCTICGHKYQTEVVPAGHDQPRSKEGVEPTCTSSGMREHWVCPYCGKYFLQEDGKYYEVRFTDIYLPPVNHDYHSTAVKPTCLEQGYTLHTCSKCGAFYQTDPVDAQGHEFIFLWNWAEDCTAAELEITCSRCDLHTVRQANVDCTVKKAPTCTDSGLADYTAGTAFMGETKTDTKPGVVLPATGHSYTGAWTWAEDNSAATLVRTCHCGETDSHEVRAAVTKVPVSCTQDGTSTYTAAVTVDGVTYRDSRRVVDAAALDHDFTGVEPAWSWAANYLSATATFTCNRGCGHSEKVTATHDRIGVTTTEPTYSTPGKRVYTATVEFRGREYSNSREEVLAALGYSYEGSWLWSEDYSSATLTLTSVSDPDRAGDYQVTATSVTTAPTCVDGGRIVYTVSYTVTDPLGKSHTFTDTREKTLDALDHNFEGVQPTWSWNYTNALATATFACAREGCSHTEQVTVQGSSAVTVEPTCTKTGIRTYSAVDITFLGKTFQVPDSTEEIPALGHVYSAPEASDWTWTEGHTSATLELTCDRCEEITEVTDSIIAVVNTATCTEGGTGTYTAEVTVDGETYQDIRTADTEALGHSYKNSWTWAADRTSATLTRSCIRSGCAESKTAESTNITYTEMEKPTCTEDGSGYYMATATIDGQQHKGYYFTSVSALGHDWQHQQSGWLYNANYTWAQALFKCTRCDKTKYVDATVTHETVPATCTAAGIQTHTASVTYGDQTYTRELGSSPVPALGHTYAQPKVSDWTWARNYSTASVMLTCTREGCDVTGSHTATVTVQNSATCTEGGTATYTAAVNAGNSTFTDERTAASDALGHSYAESWTWASDCSAATLVLTCDRCDDRVTVEAAQVAKDNGKTDLEPTCTATGASYYVATAVNAGKTYTGYGTAVIPVLDHDYSTAPTWIWSGISYATAEFTCGYNCGTTTTLTDDFPDPSKVSDPSCTVNGVTNYTASVTMGDTTWTDVKENTTSMHCTYYSGEYAWAGAEDGDGIVIDWAAGRTSGTYTATCTGCTCCGESCGCTPKTGYITSGDDTNKPESVEATGYLLLVEPAYWDGVNEPIREETGEVTFNGTLYIVLLVIDDQIYGVYDFVPYADESNYLTDGTLLYEWNEDSESYTVIGFSSQATNKSVALIPQYATHDPETKTVTGWAPIDLSLETVGGTPPAGYSPVTAIAEEAFAEETQLMAMYLPTQTLQTVGANAFYNCTALNTLLVDDLVSWNSVTMAQDTMLTDVPEGFTVPSHPFFYYFSANSDETDFATYLATLDTLEKERNGESDTPYVTHADLTGIQDLKYALSLCTTVESVYIPSTVRSIDSLSFFSATGINQLYVDDLVSWNNVNVADDAYISLMAQLEGIDGLKLPAHPFLWYFIEENGNELPRLYIQDVAGDANETTVTVGAKTFSLVEQADLSGIRDLKSHTLSFCIHVTSAVIPAELETIRDSAFLFDIGLSKLCIEDVDAWAGVTMEKDSIATLLIQQESNGTITVDVPTLPFFWNYFATNGTAETSVAVWNEGTGEYVDTTSLTVSAETINPFAFALWSSIETVTLTENVRYVGAYAFAGCFGNLTQTTLEDGTFQGQGLVVNGPSTWGVAATMKDALAGISLQEVDVSVFDSKELALSYNSSNMCAMTLFRILPTYEQGDWVFEEANGSYVLVEYKGSDTELVLPDAFYEPVTDGSGEPETVEDTGDNGDAAQPVAHSYSIGDNLFSGNTSITSVVIPDRVTAIGDGAFSGCTGLTSLTLGSGLTRIGDGAFAECSKLVNLYVDSLATWNAVTIETDTYLEKALSAELGASLELEMPSHPFLYSVWLGSRESTLYVRGAEGYAPVETAYLTDIRDLKYALSFCSSVKAVHIPSTVESVDGLSFACTTSLNTLYVDDLVSWNNVRMPEEVALPAFIRLLLAAQGDQVTEEAAALMEALESLKLPAHPFMWYVLQNLNSSSDMATHLYIEGQEDELTHANLSGIQTLNHAVALCTNLQSVYIPADLTRISDGAFAFDTSLNTLSVHDLASWNNVVLEGDSALATMIQMEMKITGLNTPSHPFMWYVFQNLGSSDMATHLYIEGQTEEVTHANLSGIQTLNHAVALCTNLQAITVSDSLESIIDGAFTLDMSLSSLYVESLDGWAAVTLPMDSFTSVYTGGESLPSHPFTWHNIIFRDKATPRLYLTGGDTELTAIAFSNEAKAINEYTFYGCKGIDTVEIGESITYIGPHAFTGCFAAVTAESEGKGIILWDSGQWCYALTPGGVQTPVDLTGIDTPTALAMAYRDNIDGVAQLYLYKEVPEEPEQETAEPEAPETESGGQTE